MLINAVLIMPVKRCLSLVKRHGFHVLHLAMIQNGSPLDITFMTMKPS